MKCEIPFVIKSLFLMSAMKHSYMSSPLKGDARILPAQPHISFISTDPIGHRRPWVQLPHHGIFRLQSVGCSALQPSSSWHQPVSSVCPPTWARFPSALVAHASARDGSDLKLVGDTAEPSAAAAAVLEGDDDLIDLAGLGGEDEDDSDEALLLVAATADQSLSLSGGGGESDGEASAAGPPTSEEEENPYTREDALSLAPADAMMGEPALEALLAEGGRDLSLERICQIFPFPLDGFQQKAVKRLVEGDKSVVVCAPTGAGKTAIAEAAAAVTLARGLRVIYTTPLKVWAA